MTINPGCSVQTREGSIFDDVQPTHNDQFFTGILRNKNGFGDGERFTILRSQIVAVLTD